MLKKFKIWQIALAAILFLQLFQIDRSIPEIDPFMDFATPLSNDPATLNLMQKACYDCHSYKTQYPWYALFVPISWWMKSHVDHGREKLNFSIWTTYDDNEQKNHLAECIEELESGRMPLKSYQIMHPASSLTIDERQRLIDFFKNLSY